MPPAAVSILLYSFLLQLILLLLRTCLPSSLTWRQEASLQAEIRRLHREADKLNTPHTFSKSARLTRQAAAKEKELEALRARSSVIWWPAVRLILPRIVQVVGFLVVTWTFYSRPVIILPVRFVQPFVWLFALPRGAKWFGGGAVSASSWMLLCNYVSSGIVSRFASPAH